MKPASTPATGPRYWAAISLASVFGANMGDLVSHTLHMGHWRGLAPLAAVFAATLLMERRSRMGHEAYYWLAIVIVRTAATNLADLGSHDFHLRYGPMSLALTIVLLALALAARRGGDRGTMPRTNGLYWAGMLAAGTLGTALGDGTSGGLGLGVALGSLLTGLLLAGVFALRARAAFAGVAFYWVTVVAVRTAGTTVGDLTADTVGLVASTVASGVLLVGLLAIWSRSEQRLGAPA